MKSGLQTLVMRIMHFIEGTVKYSLVEGVHAWVLGGLRI